MTTKKGAATPGKKGAEPPAKKADAPPQPAPKKDAAPATPPPASAEVLDPWGKAAEVHAAKAGAPGIPPAQPPAKKDAVAWPANGKKYPFALDYVGNPTAQKYNRWFDAIPTAPKGAAEACHVGPALYATQIYYSKDVDVHPLVQLTAAGLAFGTAWGKSYFESRPGRGGQSADDAEAQRIRDRLGGA